MLIIYTFETIAFIFVYYTTYSTIGGRLGIILVEIIL